MRDGPAVEAEQLVKVYQGGKTAIDGISFAVASGEIFGFLGPNGSGKTTTVRILVTLLGATSGTTRVGGFDTRRQAPRVREITGYAGQSVGVDDDLTVGENLALAGLLHHIPHEDAWARAADLAAVFSLTEVERARAGRLSGGMRRRLDIAQALMHRPPVLFLDEPTTGLDPQSRMATWQYLRRLSRDDGTTIFLTTQYLEEADRACDRVAIIDRGRLVSAGTPARLKEEVGGGRLLITIGAESDRERAARALSASGAVTRAESGAPGDPVVAHVRDTAASVPPVLRRLDEEKVPVTAVRQQQATLDDVFLRYTGQRPRAEARAAGAVSSLFAAAHGRRRAS